MCRAKQHAIDSLYMLERKQIQIEPNAMTNKTINNNDKYKNKMKTTNNNNDVQNKPNKYMNE